jgi:hypothetical protein
VPLGGAPLASGPGAFTDFIYRGGPVINNPQVYLVFLGDWSSTANQNRATRLQQFMNDLMNSNYMNMLAQYGCGSTGTVVNSVFIASTDNDLNRNDIEAIFQTAINNNTLPEPTNRSNAYILFLDDGTAVNGTFGGDTIEMCEATNDTAFGFHFHFATTANNELFYAVIPALTNACLTNSCPGDDGGCSLHLAQTREQRQTQVLSHEFSEMITNPDVEGNEGWSNNSFGGHENGDICNGQSGTITVGSNTWTVQLMYSKWDDMQSNGATTCVAGSSFPLPSLLPSCIINIDKSSYGRDEVDAFINGPTPSPAVFEAAFYLVVDGYTANQLGITSASFTGTPNVQPTLSTSPNVNGLTFTPNQLSAPEQSQLDVIQPFTWVYRVTFTNDSAFPNAPGTELPVTITASIQSVSAPIVGAAGSADIKFVDEPNPYELDGPISWLSTDLRVFQIKTGDAKFGETIGNAPADALTFIQNVIDRLNSGNTAGQTFENDISTDENASAMELSEKVNGVSVFNFAVAKVHYRSLSNPSGTARVFFRLFPCSTTSTAYDPATYARGGQGGTIIPLLGVVNGETTTIPCFAEARLDYSLSSLNQQTDLKNVQVLQPDSSGGETIQYFGCWLDINQASQNVYPLNPPSNSGPYNAADLKTIQQLVRGIHQCLVAEISLDGVTLLQNGETPGSSDKLAQRNLTIVQSDNPGSPASHRIPTTFEIRPTTLARPQVGLNDELLVDWSNVPKSSVASFYLPDLATNIVQLANERYSRHRLSAVDKDTIQCPVGGITFVPLPNGSGAGLPGLLTIDLPPSVKKGQAFKVVVRQTTGAQGKRIVPPPPIGSGKRSSGSSQIPALIRWRKVTGSFQLSIPVETKDVILPSELRRLSVLRWVQKSIPEHNRWYAVFKKYLHTMADRARAMGGNPDLVLPSPTGEWKGRPEHQRNGGEERRTFCGKVSSLIYDRFGDFQGFILDTEDGKRRFNAREPDIEKVLNRAWAERILTTIIVELDAPHRPEEIVLHCPSMPLAR